MSSASVQSRGSAAVTGAGSGLGRDIALGLAAMNYRVFGTALSAEEVADLKQASADRCPRLLGTVVKTPEVKFHHEVYNQLLWNQF